MMADAATCKDIVDTLLVSLGTCDPSCVLVLSKGMILEIFDERRGENVKFLIVKVACSGEDNKIPELGAFEHVCIRALTAKNGGAEFGLTLMQPTPMLAHSKQGSSTKMLQAYRRNKASWESSWLLSARESCTEMLQVVLDRRLSTHFLKNSILFPGGVLVHGPRGSGKTVLCQSICDHFSNIQYMCKVVWMDCQDFAHMDLEKMKKQMRIFISKAVECQPALVVADNIDIFNSSQSDGGQASMESFQFEIFSEYLSSLMDCVKEGHHCVAFLAASRSLEGVHKSLKKSGCFDNHFSMPVPTRKEKAEMYRNNLKGIHLLDEESVLDYFSQNCDGLDISDISGLVEESLCRALGSVIAGQGKRNGRSSTRHGHRRLEMSREDLGSILKDYVPCKARGTTKVIEDSKIKSWSDIQGMAEARSKLEELLSFSSKRKNLIEKCPLRLRTGALLYGPPGCGKTFLVKAAAKVCNLRCISVKGPELLNKYIGQSEAGVRDLFAKAGAAAPCILFFDEFDAIAPRRGADSTGVTDRVVNQLLAELDGVESTTNGMFVLACSSRPDMIDPALLRPGRLDHKIFCGFPTQEERESILWKELQHLSRALVGDVASRCPHFSGADLQGLLSDANLRAAKAAIAEGRDEDVVVTHQYLMEALESSRPSISEQERLRLQGVYSQFSSGEVDLSQEWRVTHA